MYNSFVHLVSSQFNSCFPLIARKRKRVDVLKPYITPEIKALIHEKHRLQRLYAKWPITYEREFKFIRNNVNKKIREAKSQYYKRFIRANANNGRGAWNVLNKLMGRAKKLSDSIELTVNDKVISNAKDVANEFNKYFTTIAETLANDIPHAVDYHQYLDSIDKNTRLIFVLPTVLEVKSVVQSMREVSPGHDNLPLFIFKDNIEIFGAMLTLLFRQSMEMGVFPREMCIAKVFCIFKAGDPREVANYRPISVLPVLSKILERLVYNRIMEHLLQYSHLSDSQCGFRA